MSKKDWKKAWLFWEKKEGMALEKAMFLFFKETQTDATTQHAMLIPLTLDETVCTLSFSIPSYITCSSAVVHYLLFCDVCVKCMCICSPHSKKPNCHDFTLSQSSLYHCWKLYSIVDFFLASAVQFQFHHFDVSPETVTNKQTNKPKERQFKTPGHHLFSLGNPPIRGR